MYTSLVNVADYAKASKNKLSSEVWDYVEGGAGRDWSVENNRNAFDKYKVMPRILNNVEGINVETIIFGRKISAPIIFAPTSPLKLFHEDAEVAVVKVSSRVNTVAICSTDSHFDLEHLSQMSDNNLWFQLYCYGCKENAESLIDRAQNANYNALVVTVDAFFPPRRERMMRNHFKLPGDVKMGNLTQPMLDGLPRRGDGSPIRHALTWQDITWIKEQSRIPVILKGIMHKDDAIKAADLGVDGIVVSNHGGRQLDQMPAPIDCLQDISLAIGRDVEIFMDGGITNGIDVIKALALGAKAVLVGRPYIYGLSVQGQRGVEEIYNILKCELEDACAQLGISSISNVNSTTLSII
ncbi:alpha-hydroxy acid oxidase [Halioxenophilus aromaticivorans]|uniref:Alpha-hydroxy acid oxidase n=1 Tax=Halioxenophilus aromaticivorans TaxID=1306992 RepID=A0AAV3U6W3_9ALTE